MNDAEAHGRELFKQGFYCAEAVLKAIAEQQGIESALVPGIATSFCSGLARTGGPCGAVTGATLALGMVYGRDDPAQPVQQTYDAVRAILDEFEKRFGSTNCRILLGVDLDTPEGQQAFQDQALHLKCRDYTGAAVALVTDVLQNDEEIDQE